MRLGGIVPELHAARLKEISALVKRAFAGDLRAVLKKPLPEAKKALKKFPTIGDPGADKILLFTKTAPVAAVPSNCVHVPLRLAFGEEKTLDLPAPPLMLRLPSLLVLRRDTQ